MLPGGTRRSSSFVAARSASILRIATLADRAGGLGVQEIILALNATVDGQTTAHYVAERLGNQLVQITRLAHGLPVGGQLDQVSGTARMFLTSADEDKTQPIRKRPQFESMELTIRLHGKGSHQKGQSDQPQQVTFRQTQIQSWNLVEFEFGRPEIFFNVPIPVDAK